MRIGRPSRNSLRKRYRDVRTDQYHYMRLQWARQGKQGDAQQFADRCMALSQKIVCQVADPVAQRAHQENAERMLLASFVAGLTGEPRKQTSYAELQDMDHAIRVELTVEEAQKQERFNNSFYTRYESSTKPRSDRERFSGPRHSPNPSGSRPFTSYRTNTAQESRIMQCKPALRCCNCNSLGHCKRLPLKSKMGKKLERS
jgi:ABC-type sugar transport system ATPase subunit